MGSSYTFNSDIWSVGVLMAVLLTNTMPYFGTIHEIIKDIYTKKIILPDNISPLAQDLLNQLLCINPKQRLSAAQAVQHPWFDDVDHTPPLYDGIYNLNNKTPDL